MRRAILAGTFYFLMVFAAGFALGTVRVLVLLPWMSELLAVLLELPVMLSISRVVAGYLIRGLAVSDAVGTRLFMGGTALVLLLGAEVFVSVLAFGQSFADHLQHYATAQGAIGLAGQVAFALIPALRLV